MATLARHIPAIAAGRKTGDAAVAGSSLAWQKLAAEAIFILGLVALCVAVLALRMAFVPVALVPRDIAFTSAGLATLAAVAAFVGAGRLRKHVAIDG